MRIINQIKNLIDDIELTRDEHESFLKHMELVKLILKNIPEYDKVTIQELSDADILSDIFYEMDESSKVLTDFITTHISFIESDLRGSDFESTLKKNADELQQLKSECKQKNEKLVELKKLQEEALKIKSKIGAVEEKIAEYDDIDIEKMKKEQEERVKYLQKLKKTEGENLQIYKKHLAENKYIHINSDKLKLISIKLKNDLEEMDKKYKEVIFLKSDDV